MRASFRPDWRESPRLFWNGAMKPTIADLFCGGGGGAMGYHRAGFKVIGIDIVEQPHYPFEFIKADALKVELPGCDAIHASPPCQGYTWATVRHRVKGKTYLDLIEPIRVRLVDAGVPHVIENVPNSPLRNPTFFEGPMFGLGVIRRRLFETNWWLPQPMYIKHKPPVMQESKADPGVMLQKSAYCTVAGNGADGWSCRLADWQEAMGIDWMDRGEITQAIPPAYTEYIGKYLRGVLSH